MEMLKGLCFVILLLFACGSAHAQNPVVPYQCPALYLDAPQWSLTDGDNAKFTVRIDPKDPEWKLKYNWTISSGKIISGQGTHSIVVERKIHYVDSTVNIGGFPHSDICHGVASERATWSVLPVAEKIKTFQGSKLERKFELGPFVDLERFKNHNLVVFMGFKKGANDETIQARESEVLNEIGGRLSRDRFELITILDGAEVTEFWRVPIGAKNPTCETCLITPTTESQECPKISIYGPTGIPRAIEMFSARLEPYDEEPGLKYSWTVTGGKLISDKNKKRIEVEFPTSGQLLVKVQVHGLPAGCPNSATESTVIDPSPRAVLIDHFDRRIIAADADLLQRVVKEILPRPNNQLVVFLNFPLKTPSQIIEGQQLVLIQELTKVGIDESRITFHTFVNGPDLIQFWRVPPGATAPKCEGCDPTPCPTFSVLGPAGVVPPGEVAKYTAKLDKIENQGQLELVWFAFYQTSHPPGEVTIPILRGQGTSAIEIIHPKFDVTAVIQVKGLRTGCPSFASETTPISHIFPNKPKAN